MKSIMKYTRITINLPDYIYQNLRQVAEPRGISNYVSDVLAKTFALTKNQKKGYPFKDFYSEMLHGKKQKLSSKQIKKNSNTGRL